MTDNTELAADGRHAIVASLIRDAIEIGTDEAADWNAERVLAYLSAPAPTAGLAEGVEAWEPTAEDVR
jgi:hypothetical protein